MVDCLTVTWFHAYLKSMQNLAVSGIVIKLNGFGAALLRKVFVKNDIFIPQNRIGVINNSLN